MRKLFTALCLAFWLPVFLYGQSDTQILSRVLQQFSKVHGGSSVRSTIESVYLRGVQFQGGRSLPLTIHKKRPDNIRYQLGEGREAVILGYDGARAWEQVNSGGEVTVEPLGGEAMALLRAEAKFSSPLLDDLYDPRLSIELQGRENVADEPAYCLVIMDRENGGGVRYYVSGISYYILKKVEFDAEGDEILETRYRDHRLVEGYPFAYEVENRIDGETVALTQFEEIKANAGLLSFYFEMPEKSDR